jgi:N-acetyl-anhydromuramyl-L-alanine amidase AmpD
MIKNLEQKTNRKIDKIIIHCSASKEGQKMTVEQIDKMHRQRGFAGIGYHFVIYLDGSIHDGRDISKVGAHTTGYNTGSIGICYIGGLDKNGKIKDTRNYVQKNALYHLVKRLMEIYPIKEVKGHRDYSPDTNGDGVISKYEWIKGCPCFEVSEFMEEYNLNQYLK